MKSRNYHLRNAVAALLVIASLPLFAQKVSDAEVPAIVREAFSKFFPRTSKPAWEKEDGNYEANFKQKGLKKSATFNSDGGWLETETEIPANALPQAAADYLETNCAGKQIKDASLIKKTSGKEIYEANVDGMDYIFDVHGKFIKKQKD